MRSPLAQHVGPDAGDPAEVRRMRLAAYHAGVVLIELDRVRDQAARLVIEGEARRQLGDGR